MILLLLGLLPALLVNLAAMAVSRRRPSAPFALLQGVLGVGACLAACALVLIPQGRAQLDSADGILRLTASRSLILLCIALILAHRWRAERS